MKTYKPFTIGVPVLLIYETNANTILFKAYKSRALKLIESYILACKASISNYHGKGGH